MVVDVVDANIKQKNEKPLGIKLLAINLLTYLLKKMLLLYYKKKYLPLQSFFQTIDHIYLNKIENQLNTL